MKTCLLSSLARGVDMHCEKFYTLKFEPSRVELKCGKFYIKSSSSKKKAAYDQARVEFQASSLWVESTLSLALCQLNSIQFTQWLLLDAINATAIGQSPMLATGLAWVTRCSIKQELWAWQGIRLQLQQEKRVLLMGRNLPFLSLSKFGLKSHAVGTVG